MTLASVEDRVQAGIDQLDDTLDPGWRSRINLEDLRMQSNFRCVLGQIFGDFWVGVDEVLDIPNTEVPPFTDRGQNITEFMTERVTPYGFWTDDPADYAKLNVAWREALAA